MDLVHFMPDETIAFLTLIVNILLLFVNVKTLYDNEQRPPH